MTFIHALILLQTFRLVNLPNSGVKIINVFRIVKGVMEKWTAAVLTRAMKKTAVRK